MSSVGNHAGMTVLLGGRSRAQLHPEGEFAASVGTMKQEFDDAYRRGELSSSSLIHIDVPIRRWGFGFDHDQNLVPPDTPKLTRLEAEIKDELENDPAESRLLESIWRTGRIDWIINSLQNKLDTAARQRLIARSKFIPAGAAGSVKPLGSGLVTPAKDLEWDRDMRKLNGVIRNHGGVPKPQNASLDQFDQRRGIRVPGCVAECFWEETANRHGVVLKCSTQVGKKAPVSSARERVSECMRVLI